MTIAYHIKQCASSYIFVDLVGSKTQCLVAVLDGADLLPAATVARESPRRGTELQQHPSLNSMVVRQPLMSAQLFSFVPAKAVSPTVPAAMDHGVTDLGEELVLRPHTFFRSVCYTCLPPLAQPKSKQHLRFSAVPTREQTPGIIPPSHPIHSTSLHAYLGVLGVHMHRDLWPRPWPWPCRDQGGPIADGCIT